MPQLDINTFPRSLSDLESGKCRHGDMFTGDGDEKMHANPDSARNRSITPPCDNQTNPLKPPAWFDRSRFKAGCAFFRDFTFSVLFGQLAALLVGFTVERLTRALIYTNASSQPDSARDRYLKTAAHLALWHTFEGVVKDGIGYPTDGSENDKPEHKQHDKSTDGGCIGNSNNEHTDDEPLPGTCYDDIFSPGSRAGRSLLSVRSMHSSVRHRMNHTSEGAKYTEYEEDSHREMSKHEIKTNRNVSEPSVADPYDVPITDKVALAERNLSQYDMALVQTGFIGPFLLFPHRLGIPTRYHKTLLGDYVYFWRVIGHCLGIEPKYNICGGGLDHATQICKEVETQIIVPGLKTPSVEFSLLSRAFLNGMAKELPVLSGPGIYAYVLPSFGLDAPALTIFDTLIYGLIRLVFALYFRITCFRKVLNSLILKQTRFLCDQLVF